MRAADEVAAAGRELRRLIGTDDLRDDSIIEVFADGDLASNVGASPRSASELRDFFAAAPRRAPRTAEVVRGAVAAFWRWAGAGFGVVDAATRVRRLEACLRCEDYVDAPHEILYTAAMAATREAKVCRQCGCFVAKKVRLATERCPRDAWPPAYPNGIGANSGCTWVSNSAGNDTSSSAKSAEQSVSAVFKCGGIT